MTTPNPVDYVLPMPAALTDETKRRRHVMAIRVTTAEYERLHAEANRLGLSITDYVRQHLPAFKAA